MVINFPTVVSFIGTIMSFSFALRLRNFKVNEIAPKSRAGLSREERQRKITIGRRIVYGVSAFMLASAFLFAWMANSN
jgi:hypothetical protein